MAFLIATRLRALPVLLLVLGALACSPAWDWREIELQGADLRASFPCKPLIREEGRKGLAVCEHRGLQFSIAWEALDDGSRLREALAQSAPGMAKRLGLKVQGRTTDVDAPHGAVSFPESGAHLMDSDARAALLVTWVRGARVYQALVHGPAGQLGPGRPFHEGLKHLGSAKRPG